MVLLLHYRVDFMLVILLIRRRSLLLLQLFLELVQTFELPMRPSLHAMLAALLLERGYTHAQLSRRRINREMEAS